ncbi:MAG: Ig-like domain-containing protein [Anaeromyxobacter sp.]
MSRILHLAPCLALLALAGCKSVQEPLSCETSDQCPSGSTCERGYCHEGVGIAIASPTGPIWTSGAVDIQVEVAAEVSAVRIVVDEEERGRVSAPFLYTLDTTTLAEGRREVWAEAIVNGQRFPSTHLEVNVDRTKPLPPTFTSPAATNLQPVPLQGTTEGSARVQLRYGGAPVGDAIQATAGGAWVTTMALAPGAHVFEATASDRAGNTSAPASWTVTVDRTSPSVLTRAPSGDSVLSRTAVVVTFDEPMRPGSVTASSLVVTASGGQAPAMGAPALSSDGLTLTVPVLTAGTVPNSLTATLSGLTDLAGNALPVDSWSWGTPEWVPLGTRMYIGAEALSYDWALLPSGSAVMVAQDDYASCANRVQLWSGDAWTLLAPPSHGGSIWYCGGSSVAADLQGGVLLASVHRIGGVEQLYVDRYQDGTWVTLGGALNMDATHPAARPVIRVDSAGTPFVLWRDRERDRPPVRLQLERHDLGAPVGGRERRLRPARRRDRLRSGHGTRRAGVGPVHQWRQPQAQPAPGDLDHAQPALLAWPRGRRGRDHGGRLRVGAGGRDHQR